MCCWLVAKYMKGVYIYMSLVAGMEIFMLHINIYICLYTFLVAAVQIEWVQVECTKNAYV